MRKLLVRLTMAACFASASLAHAETGAATQKPEPASQETTAKASAKPAANTAAAKPKKTAVTKAADKKTVDKKTTSAKTQKAAAKKPVAKNTRKVLTIKDTIASASAAAAAASGGTYAFSKAAKAYLVRVQNKDLWAAGDEEQLPPASLTKIMTALLVLEDYHPDDVVTISKEAAAEPRSNIGLRTGDQMYVKDLLAAALIHSANDACHALADWRDGNEEKFVERMNRRAQELGLKNTHFVNACGLDAPGHYSTARDIAVLADHALQNPTFAELVGTQKMAIRSVDGRRRFSFNTTNALVGHYPGMKGGKTGFTNGAGPCLVAMAERDGVRVLLVLLNAHNRWWNASGMFDQAFAQANRS